MSKDIMAGVLFSFNSIHLLDAIKSEIITMRLRWKILGPAIGLPRTVQANRCARPEKTLTRAFVL